MDDMIALVTSTISTASVVARGLEELGHHVGVQVSYGTNHTFLERHDKSPPQQLPRNQKPKLFGIEAKTFWN